MRLLFRSVSESPVRWPRLCLACAPPPAVAPSAFPPPRDRPQPLPQDQPPTCGVPPRPLPCASVFRSFPCKAPPIGQVLPDACAPALADRTAAFQWSPAAQDRNSTRPRLGGHCGGVCRFNVHYSSDPDCGPSFIRHPTSRSSEARWLGTEWIRQVI